MATFTYEQFMKMIEDSERGLNASQELKHFNIIPEYSALRKKNNKNSFDIGRMKILEYIINCVKNDPINGDYYNKENGQLIIDAGNELNKDGGERSMRDPLVWSFIPKRYHREIDNYWSGIGSWMG
jgi:hypothetical protein